MTIQTMLFKENEGVTVQNFGSTVSRWNELRSAFDVNQFSAAVDAKEVSENLGKGSTNHFTLFSDYDLSDHKAAENGAKEQLPTASPVQAEYRGHFELGFGQPLVCPKLPYADQYYGVYSTYGTQIAGRVMLPMSMTSDGGPIYVNAKQYNGIMRRRKKRAEMELETKMLKLRKPFLHMSRHLHAMRRPRGNGGRFLNTKKSNNSPKEANQSGKHHFSQQTRYQSSEAQQTDLGINTRPTSAGSEVTSSHIYSGHPYHLHPGFQAFSTMGNTGLGITMGTGNYLKV